jgi:DNA repair protein RecO (recombination protein O)
MKRSNEMVTIASSDSCHARVSAPTVSQAIGGDSAYVLHHYDWSEASLIVELWTRAQGRVVAVAKGAKRPYSQLRGVLLPFQRLQVQFTKTRTQNSSAPQAMMAETPLLVLRQAEWQALGLPCHGGSMLVGTYANEVLLRFVPRHDPHPVLFDRYVQLLPYLALPDSKWVEAALRAWELLVLRAQGLLPDLAEAAAHSDLSSGYVIDAQLGLRRATADERGLESHTCRLLESGLEGPTMQTLVNACLQVLPELKTQLRAFLQYHVGPSGWRTRQLMMELAKS